MGWLYIPAQPPKGIVQICHGMAEHMGRYHDFMRCLAQNGYVACGIDQLGHGCSVTEERYGFFAEREGWKLLVEDQYKFHRIVHAEVPGQVASALLGHSMGSFIARLYAAKYGSTIKALLLSGTARGGMRVSLGVQAAELSARTHGAYYVDKRLQQMALGAANDRFKPLATPYDWLTRDVELAKRFQEDPLCGFVFTASAYRDLFTLLEKANGKACFQATPSQLPILIFSGSMDPVGEFGKGPEQVYQRYVKAGVRNVQLTLYEGARHETLNEVNRSQVYEMVVRWLDERFQPEEEPVADEQEGYET